MVRSASEERGRDRGREGRDRDKPLYMISVAAELTGCLLYTSPSPRD